MKYKLREARPLHLVPSSAFSLPARPRLINQGPLVAGAPILMAASVMTTKWHQQKRPWSYGKGLGQASGDLGVASGGLCIPEEVSKRTLEIRDRSASFPALSPVLSLGHCLERAFRRHLLNQRREGAGLCHPSIQEGQQSYPETESPAGMETLYVEYPYRNSMCESEITSIYLSLLIWERA